MIKPAAPVDGGADSNATLFNRLLTQQAANRFQNVNESKVMPNPVQK